MANTINRDMMRILKDTVRHSVEGVSVWCGCTWGKDDEPIEWEVNWSAWGDQNPTVTREYAARLMKAADLAEMLTRLKMVQVYDSDKTLNDMLVNDGIEATKEYYKNLEMLVAEYIKACDGTALAELILNR